MTRVDILPEAIANGDVQYRAIAGQRQSVGKTAGEALDALSVQLPADKKGTLIVIQVFQPDEFFTEDKCARLDELMGRWRAARDAGNALTATEQAELDSLVEEELTASGRRAAGMIQELKR
jgi:hypothetical protein